MNYRLFCLLSCLLTGLSLAMLPPSANADEIADLTPPDEPHSALTEAAEPPISPELPIHEAEEPSPAVSLQPQVQPVAPPAALPETGSSLAADLAPADDSLNGVAQVTSVSQLADVQPTDWAYQALQSLVERYGCIAGYPDGTYKGQRALTRFEFAAGMNACLDRINELLTASTANLATKEDLATLQRLQEEFAAELATLRGRVDQLDNRVAELESNQFSTTTKLSGEVIFSRGAGLWRISGR